MAARTIQVSGADTSLMHVAAREYGDARQWVRLAEANGLIECLLNGVTTLRIPDSDPTATTGLANP